MGKKSSFPNKQLGHAGINPSETVANADTWRRLREESSAPRPAGDFRSKLAPWAAVRPRAKAKEPVATPPVPVAAPAPASPPPAAHNGANVAQRALDGVDAEHKGTKLGGKALEVPQSPPPRTIITHVSPAPRPEGRVKVPQYGRDVAPAGRATRAILGNHSTPTREAPISTSKASHALMLSRFCQYMLVTNPHGFYGSWKKVFEGTIARACDSLATSSVIDAPDFLTSFSKLICEEVLEDAIRFNAPVHGQNFSTHGFLLDTVSSTPILKRRIQHTLDSVATQFTREFMRENGISSATAQSRA